MDENTFDILRSLVKRTRCKPNWLFKLEDREGVLRLCIIVVGPDSRIEGEEIQVSHFFPVPIATYNEKTWRRWMFECCRRLENHELGEFFMVDGERPFAPLHGPGEDPYTVHEFRDEVDARTRQDGAVL